MSYVTHIVGAGAFEKMLGRARRTDMLVAAAVGKSLAELQANHKKKQIKTGTNSKDKPVKGRWTTRSGELRKSFHMDWTQGRREGAYGSDKDRVLKMEGGGVIKPKRGKYLAIPTENAPKKVWPRYVPNLFAVRTRRRNLVLAESTGDSLRVMYVLKKSVKLPPRPTLDRAVEATAKRREKRFADIVEREIWGRN